MQKQDLFEMPKQRLRRSANKSDAIAERRKHGRASLNAKSLDNEPYIQSLKILISGQDTIIKILEKLLQEERAKIKLQQKTIAKLTKRNDQLSGHLRGYLYPKRPGGTADPE